MIVVGINAYHGDASAVLLRDGQLVAAVEEERFSRVKHAAGFPAASVRACLEMAGARGQDVDHFAVSRDPRAHLWRKALFAIRHRPGVDLVRSRLGNFRKVREVTQAVADTLGTDVERVRARMHWVEHHPAHLASAFLVSPFEEAAVCAIDGFGDFVSTSWGVGRGHRLDVRHRIFFPHSLGLLYLAVTQYLGFRGYGDEYKVMGLAPYGAPDLAPALRRVIRLDPDGRFTLDLAYFLHTAEGVSMTWDGGAPTIGRAYTPKLEALLGPARDPEARLEPRHEAIAASLQQVFEEAVVHVLAAVHGATRASRLCLAGGCAMNSVMNGKVRERSPFKELYVQPAAADNGTALGAALHVWHQTLGQPRGFVMEHGAWGPEATDAEIRVAMAARGRELEGCRLREWHDEERLCDATAERLAEGRIVGWFQGRMEWGARALGQRSILADPRRPDMREILNARIKIRETFRPFAPSIVEEALDEYFVGAAPDPFMMQVYPVRPEKRPIIPAVTHVDGTGRPQTVSRRHTPLYWTLIKAFEKRTGVPVLLNTSFNENEPIVRAPAQALDCFLRTGMDVLVLGPYVIEKGA